MMLMNNSKMVELIFGLHLQLNYVDKLPDEFTNIFDSIGIGTEVYLTRLYGAGRRKLTDIINDYKGIHVVVTNTEHFTQEWKYF